MFWIRLQISTMLVLVLASAGCVDAPLSPPTEVATLARVAAEVSVSYPGPHPVTGEPLTSIQEAIDAVMELTVCGGGTVEIDAGEYTEGFHIPNLAAVLAQRLPPGCQLPSVRGAGAGRTRIIADFPSPQPPGPPLVNIGGAPFAEPFPGASGDDRFFQGGELCCMEIVHGSNAPIIAIGSVWTRQSTFRDIVVTGGWPHGIQLFQVSEASIERNTFSGTGMGTAIDVRFPGEFSDVLPEGQPEIRIVGNIVVGAEEGIRTVFVQDAVIEGNVVDAVSVCFFAGGSVDLLYDDNGCLNAQDPNGGNLRVLTSREIRWQGGCVSDATAVVTLGFDDTGFPYDLNAPWVAPRFDALGPGGDILIEDVLTGYVTQVVSHCPGSPDRGPECDAAPDFGDRDVTLRGVVNDPSVDCAALFTNQAVPVDPRGNEPDR